MSAATPGLSNIGDAERGKGGALLFLVRGSPRAVVIAAVAGVLSGAATTAILGLIQRAATTGHLSLRGLAVFLGLAVGYVATRVGSTAVITNIVQTSVAELRIGLARSIVALPLRKAQEIGPARLLALLAEDVTVLANSLPFAAQLVASATLLAACLGYLAWLSLRSFAVFMVLLLIGLPIHEVISARASRRAGRARELADAVYRHTRALITGIKELKLDGDRRERFLEEELCVGSRAHAAANVAASTRFTAASSWASLVFFACIAVLLGTKAGAGSLEPGVATSYALVLVYILAPLGDLMKALGALRRSSVALQRIRRVEAEIVGAPQKPANGPPETPRPASWNRLELVGVTHRYTTDQDDHPFVLGPIDLAFRPGEIVIVIGANGSGKSTLAKLLTGLYAPETGTVRLDGVDVTDETRDAYRQHFSAIFADYYLFDRAIFPEWVSAGLVAKSFLTRLELDQRVTFDGKRFDNRGLSQGQRKRLAFLLARLEDRPIYVFDEWASDQDPFYKLLFYTELLAELRDQNKLVVVISHDERFRSVADRVVLVEQGRIVGDRF